MTKINARIIALRKAMSQEQIDAYIIPSADPHQSEYVAEYWKYREWISGFTGSAGTAVVTQKEAGLWTDSRYFIQGEKELEDSEFQLKKLKIPHTPEYLEWLKETLPFGSSIGGDPSCFSIDQMAQMEAHFAEAGFRLIFKENLLEKIWVDRPAFPSEMIFDHPIKYAGKSRAEKIEFIQSKMADHGVDYCLISTLDDLAWTFNIRGNDVQYNPVAPGFALISRQLSHLFLNPNKIPENLQNDLNEDGIQIWSYDSLENFLLTLDVSKTIWVDPKKINLKIGTSIACNILASPSIVEGLKGIKNEVEIAQMKEAMVGDGVALTKTIMWLEKTLETTSISEYDLAQKVADFRSKMPGYFGESFGAIIGYKGNGAIVHYKPEKETSATIKNEGILLMDSGGQYFQGTTDITRTFSFSDPTDDQKLHYTLVLKGHIALASLVFPRGTRGNQMEILARSALWKHGLNYGHGTGHGVGSFLNVHEGPQSIGSGASGKSNLPIEIGMLTSNEPGFYLENKYGIRIENLILTVPFEETNFGQFLTFDTVTLFPIATNLIDFSFLTKDEVSWLNDYHSKVFEKLAPHLNDEEVMWLKTKCVQI